MAECANCRRHLSETESSMNCPCRPQFDALEAEVDRLRAVEATVGKFIAERSQVITAINNCAPESTADYWRWQGHAESRRVLSEDLKRLEADRG